MNRLFFETTFVILLVVGGGFVSSVPYFDLDDEIEALEPLARGDDSLDSPEVFTDAVVTGDNNGPGGSAFVPSLFPIYGNPFFSDPVFSTFKKFDFGIHESVPWWKGPNVCIDRVEEDDSNDKKDIDGDDGIEKATKGSTDIDFRPQNLFGSFQFSVNSCIEKPHKHSCKKIYSKNGQKKTLTVTRQCCQGFGRPSNAKFTDVCQKLEVKSFEDTATDMGGSEFMRSVKNNGLEDMLKSNITLFLPSNDAFTKFSEQMFENNLVYVPMGNRRRRRSTDQTGFTSKDLLKNHMVDGINRIDDLANEQVLKTKLDNSSIRINIYSRPRGPLFTANCAPLLKVDQLVNNGIMHTTDRVLSPVTDNVMDIIRKRSDMAVFRTVLEKTKLHELLEGNKPVTVFVPTDKALEKLDMTLRRKLKEGKGCAANILKNHVLDFTLCSEAANARAVPVSYNILGEPIRFERKINDETELESDDIFLNGEVRIIESDIVGTNGVIHVVDAVIPSDSSRSISSLMQDKNLTVFKNLLEASGLQNEFDDYDNATFFIPVDKAFEDSKWAKAIQENPDQLKSNPELQSFLRAHVIHPKIKTCDLKEDLFKSVSGSNLRVNLYSTHPIFTNVMNRATINCARLVHFDDESCGTVLHQVERQLENPKNDLLSLLETNPKYSKFLEAVKVANLTNLLKDNNDSYTIFLPKNEVFREFDIDVTSRPGEAERFVKDHIVNDIVCCAGIAPTNWPFVRTIESVSGKHLRINRERRPKVENATINKCDVLATNGIVHEINDVIITKQRQTHNPTNVNDYDILKDVFF